MHGPDDQTAKVLGTLLQNPRLREPLRHIDVQFDEDSLWTQSHSRLLAISLMQILKPDRVVHEGRKGAAGNLLNGTALHHLRHLSLSCINVAALQPSRISRLESLELNGCAGVEEFLDRLANEVPSSLRVVRITAHSKSGRSQAYTAWLRSAQNVENITLCIGGLARVIPLDDIGAHGSTLRTLILDARRNLLDPASVCAYSPDDLRRVVNMCCRLRTLGMPIDLRDYQRQRYTRSPQLVRSPRRKVAAKRRIGKEANMDDFAAREEDVIFKAVMY
ncbi:hypothetical protein CKAH01_14325 [Colletotrichum kahawae]|uniref:F-box domain-containing protein n=1 Tax=Colletotrichum kahawae TaxID=34407 RepID=A0AAD9YL85_COLKA|nr:hypothetical protein CKAH01_14325 [Colletotrichum kahawae]